MVYTHWEKAPSTGAPSRHRSPSVYASIVLFSFAVGVLSGLMGIGGGILIMPFLIFAYGVSTKVSAGTSMFIVIFSSLFGVLGHSAFGSLDYSLILATAAAVAAGGLIGARLMVRTKAEWIKAGFGIIMWVFALQLIVKLL